MSNNNAVAVNRLSDPEYLAAVEAIKDDIESIFEDFEDREGFGTTFSSIEVLDDVLQVLTQGTGFNLRLIYADNGSLVPRGQTGE